MLTKLYLTITGMSDEYFPGVVARHHILHTLDTGYELGSSGITPEAITTLIALYAVLSPVLLGSEAASEVLDDSSVLDSGSSVHTKGSKLTLGECNVTNMEIPYILLEGAWACPWMNMSLISMSKLMQDGFTLIAEGVYLLSGSFTPQAGV